MDYDVIIIGGGPIGLTCGIEAKKNNLKYLILEKGVLVNSLYNFPTNMTFFSTSQLLEIGEVPFISHSDKPTRRESLEYYRRVLQSWDLNINFFEPVQTFSVTNDGRYKLVSNKNIYNTKAIIIATGFYDTPRKLNIPGEDLPKVKHYYDEPHPYVGQKLIVIGAANSACDVALETYYKGSEVTMVVRNSELYPKVKYWIKPNIENRIKEGSIKAFFNSNILEIKNDSVIINTPQGNIEYPNDFVLAMTGYQPNYKLLENFGLKFSNDEHRIPIQNEETHESNLPNVYLAGVVKSGKKTSTLFIENSREHAKEIIQHFLKQHEPIN